MAKTVLAEEDKRYLKILVLELIQTRKLVDALAETLVKLSDKEFLKALNASRDELKESQVDCYEGKLAAQLGAVEKEFQP